MKNEAKAIIKKKTIHKIIDTVVKRFPFSMKKEKFKLLFTS